MGDKGRRGDREKGREGETGSAQVSETGGTRGRGDREKSRQGETGSAGEGGMETRWIDKREVEGVSG